MAAFTAYYRAWRRRISPLMLQCELYMDKVVFIGLLFSRYGIDLTEERVRAVLEAVWPTISKEVRSFLDLVGFNTCFIPNFGTLTGPLRAISRTGIPFIWG